MRWKIRAASWEEFPHFSVHLPADSAAQAEVVQMRHALAHRKPLLGRISGKPEFHILHLPENIGGAGGFAKGLEDLGKTDCDWMKRLWVVSMAPAVITVPE